MKPAMRRGASTAEEVAEHIKRSLALRNDREAWRWLLQLTDDFRGSALSGRLFLVGKAPAPTGDNRYDAVLAALVEHLCVEAGVGIPPWTWEPFRFAEPWWFVAGLPALEALAFRDSPICFKIHGVFVTAEAFDRA